MKMRSIRGTYKVVVAFSFFVIYGTAQGMLGEFTKESFQKMCEKTGKTYLNFLVNHKKSFMTYGITVGVASLFGGLTTKLFSRRLNDYVPRAPSLDLSKKGSSLGESLKVSKQKVRQCLGLTEGEIIPKDWFELLKQNQNEIGGVQSDEMKFKQYYQKLIVYFGQNVPEPRKLVDVLRAKVKNAVLKEQTESNNRMLKFKLGIKDVFEAEEFAHEVSLLRT